MIRMEAVACLAFMLNVSLILPGAAYDRLYRFLTITTKDKTGFVFDCATAHLISLSGMDTIQVNNHICSLFIHCHKHTNTNNTLTQNTKHIHTNAGGGATWTWRADGLFTKDIQDNHDDVLQLPN